MLRWLKRLLFGSEHPSLRRIMACEDTIAALGARVDQRYDELRALRGVVSRRLRTENEPEDDVGEANAPTPDIAPRPAASTAHLARRFKGG